MKLIRITGFVLLGIFGYIPFSFAQAHANQSTMPKEYQEIIIRQRGEMNPNIDIHIKNGEVWINGKKYDQYSDSSLTVIERKLPLRNGNSYIFEESPQPHVRIYPPRRNPSNESKPLLGVMTSPAQNNQGAQIEEVMSGTAADSAGLKAGDIIIQVDDHTIHSPAELSDVVQSYKPGDVVTITFLRNQQKHTTKARLGTQENDAADLLGINPMPDFPGPDRMPRFPMPGPNNPNFFRYFHPFLYPNASPKLGMSIQDTENGGGVKVLKVEPNQPAAKAGVKVGDIITEYGGQQIHDINDMVQALQENSHASSVTMKLKRDGQIKELTIQLPHRLRKMDL